MDSLIGSLLERTLSTQSFRLRQDEVKARVNKVAERLELVIAEVIAHPFTLNAASVAVAGTVYNPAADWEAAGVPLE
jgi:hypothetical protein